MTPTPASNEPHVAAAKPESGWSLVRFFVLLALGAWVLRSFIVAPFSIPSGSMLPTLYIGDYLLVAKWPYGYSQYSYPFGFPRYSGRVFARLPERGDVVVFRHPSSEMDLVKRVVGLPGDTVEVRGGALILNGTPITRTALAPTPVPVTVNSPCRTVPPAPPVVEKRAGTPVCLYRAYRETLPDGPSFITLDQVDDAEADDFGPVTVLDGHVFLMGDNRDDSLDSRFGAERGGVGMVPVENLIGRALVTFWSTDGSANYANPISWLTGLRGERVGNGYTDGGK
ncbi:MAG: signal peptidase I [Sphingomicrobium sp.]